MSMTTNPREKHPGTQRQYLDLKTSTTVHTGTETAVIAAPPAGYCVNIWGVFGIAGGADIAGWDITDGANGTVTVACNKYTSMNITYPMPIKCAEATALDITDAHSIIRSTTKVSVIYYTIVPV
jgi:hypothetical protein